MKKTPSLKASIPAIGALFALGSSCLLAQESGSVATDLGDLDPLRIKSDKKEAPENQISAFLTDTPLIDIPQSLSVVTQDEIRDRGFDSLNDVIDYIPGVINSQGEGHRDSHSFRGQARTTADYYIDGMRDDVQYFRPLYNVERLEILKGPNALFFGRGGTGGVLNRVMKKPVLGADFGEIVVDLDTFGAFGTQFDYNHASGDNSAFRLNVFFESLENHRDLYDGERIGINPTWMVQLSEDTSIDFSFEYMDHERFIDRGIPALGGRPAYGLNGITFGDSELNFTELEAYTFRTTLNHKISEDWKTQVSAFAGTYDKVYSNVFPTTFDGTLVGIDGYIDSTERDRFQFSGDLIGEFSTGPLDHKVVIGAEYIHTSSDQDRFTETWTGAGGPFTAAGFRMSNGTVLGPGGDTLVFNVLSDDTRATVDSYSLILHDEIAINDHLDVVIGARLETFDISVRDVVTPANSASRSDTEISPRLGFVFKPQENLSIYSSYSETFLPRSGEQYANINPPANALDPDTFTNLEAGVKWDVTDDSSFTFAVFQIEQTSLQPGVVPGTFNEVETETVGLEAAYQGRLTDWWSLNAGYTFLDGEVASGANAGNTPREQPEHVFSLWNAFRVTEKFGFGIGMIYQDSHFANSDNMVLLPSFVRFDAAAHYDIDEDSRIQLNIENLLDTEYYPHSHRNSNITVGAPINASVMYTKKF